MMDKSVYNTYSIHDTAEQERRISMAALHPRDLASAIGAMYKRVGKHLGLFGKYKPHQGSKEKARRLRQMERGRGRVNGSDTGV